MGLIYLTDSIKISGTLTLRNRDVHHSNGDCRNAESKQAACRVSCNGPRHNTCTARFLLLPWLAFLPIILARTALRSHNPHLKLALLQKQQCCCRPNELATSPANCITQNTSRKFKLFTNWSAGNNKLSSLVL